MDIKKLLKPNIHSLRAYEAKEIACRVKLDANESPFGFKKGLETIKKFNTNRYPDPEAKELKKTLAKDIGVGQDNLLCGNGSDELISYLITTFGGPVLYPVPTFSMYGIISQALGEKYIEIPLSEEFDLDIEKTLKCIKQDKPKLTFLSSPNNPTGNCFSSDSILKIIKTSKGIVVVDEAYQPFAHSTGFVAMLKNYKNLIILRTLSKVGLAGLRVGFLIADVEIINEVNKVRLPFNLNHISQAVAVNALKDKRLLRTHIKTVVSERKRLFRLLKKTKGIEPYPSEANFVLFRTDNPDKIYKDLLKKGVLIRNMNNALKGCLRVTVGSPEENTIFLKALEDIVKLK